MSYRLEDFTSDPAGCTYPFGLDVSKAAATLRRLAYDLERRSGTLISGVTVVEKAVVDNFAVTTIIMRLTVPKENPEAPRPL